MKIILFDIDETLLSCDTANVASSKQMFKKVFNIKATEKSIVTAGKTEKGIIEEVVRVVKQLPEDAEIDVPNKAYQVWAKEASIFLQKHPPKVLPGIVELLKYLEKQNGIND